MPLLPTDWGIPGVRLGRLLRGAFVPRRTRRPATVPPLLNNPAPINNPAPNIATASAVAPPALLQVQFSTPPVITREALDAWLKEEGQSPQESVERTEAARIIASYSNDQIINGIPSTLNFMNLEHITSLPPLNVYGSLCLMRCSRLESLSPGTKIGGACNCRGCTSLALLPDDLVIGANLCLVDCIKMSAIPEPVLEQINTKVGLNRPPMIESTGSGVSVHHINDWESRYKNINFKHEITLNNDSAESWFLKLPTAPPDVLEAFKKEDMNECPISLERLGEDMDHPVLYKRFITSPGKDPRLFVDIFSAESFFNLLVGNRRHPKAATRIVLEDIYRITTEQAASLIP